MDYANIILEMLDRIKKLEQDVSELKQADRSSQTTSVDGERTTHIENAKYSARRR